MVTPRRLMLLLAVILLAGALLAMATSDAGGTEGPPDTRPECPTVVTGNTTTTLEGDLPCGFTDGIPVGCYDPQPGDPCYEGTTTTTTGVVLIPPITITRPQPALVAPAYTG